MCLSDCSSCKYLDRTPHHSGDIICSVNPSYATVWRRIESLDESTLNCVPIDECRDFERDPSFEIKEISFSLTFSSWQTLIRESGHPAIIKALNDTLIQLNLSLTAQQWQVIADSNTDPHVRVSLEAEGIKPQREPWIHIDSSCIDSLAYDRETNKLKIRFNSGQVYQYDNVLHSDFLALLDADSKGRFFHRHIKDAFPYRQI